MDLRELPTAAGEPERGRVVYREFRLTSGNPLATVALAALVIALGGALLLVGFTLLAGLAVVGGVVGAGTLLYRTLTGRGRLGRSDRAASPLRLDPSREVFPDRRDSPRLEPPRER